MSGNMLGGQWRWFQGSVLALAPEGWPPGGDGGVAGSRLELMSSTNPGRG
jgi:hypothetical protein